MHVAHGSPLLPLKSAKNRCDRLNPHIAIVLAKTESRRLLLSQWFQRVANGAMMAARQEAINILSGAIKRIPRRKAAAPQLIAETLFAIYMATTLEWLIREDEPGTWLINNMRARPKLGLEGMA